MGRLAPTTALALGLLACQAGDHGGVESSAAVEFFERGVVILDADGETTFDAVLARSARADAVFLGETHQDETTHRFERDVYAGLIERTGGKVVLALEMFARDAQPILDRYVAGDIDEASFLAESRPWGNYRTGYRPLIELARAHGLPVVASNVPADLRRKVSAGGAEAFATLTAEERSWVAPELLPNSEAYWRRFERVVRGHMDVSPGSESLLYSGQSQWDNTMGYSCAEALEAYPGFVVLHVNGGFHSAYHDGTVAQLRARRPQTKVVTIAIQPVSDINDWSARFEPMLADFVVVADGRARGTDGAFHAVRSQRELRYALHVPATATDLEPVPLLIFLGDDGLRAEDSLAYWELALGDEAAIAVIEPPFPQEEVDQTLGGRWFWDDTYHSDLATLSGALDEVQRYVTEHHPVVDGSERLVTVIAGDGTGGTVVARAAFHGAWMKALANRPRRNEKLREWPVPDRSGPELAVVVSTEEERAWWEEELAQYSAVGLEARLDLGGTMLRELERRVRSALGLPQLRAGALGPEEAGAPTAKGRLWQALAARAKERGTVVPTVAELPGMLVRGEASGEALPPATGLFGGTTLIVVPAGATAEEREAWRALESTDVMSVHGRFFRLRVAFEDAEPGLSDVLAELQSAGRSNVLIVPGVFFADSERMKLTSLAAESFRAGMQISFLPGLGGRLHLAR